ncbi:hypothetical protein DFH06DRAFT_1142868 [Mycena polygramma]|nr:hypothetical protein DFH06DRAFT_1142868 [Mycena polygramma]
MAHNLLITDGIERTPRRFDLPRENGQPTTAEMVAYPVHVVPKLYTLVEVPIAGFVWGWREGRNSGLAEGWWLVKALDGVTLSQKTGVLHKHPGFLRKSDTLVSIRAKKERSSMGYIFLAAFVLYVQRFHEPPALCKTRIPAFSPPPNKARYRYNMNWVSDHLCGRGLTILTRKVKSPRFSGSVRKLAWFSNKRRAEFSTLFVVGHFFVCILGIPAIVLHPYFRSTRIPPGVVRGEKTKKETSITEMHGGVPSRTSVSRIVVCARRKLPWCTPRATPRSAVQFAPQFDLLQRTLPFLHKKRLDTERI